MDKDDLKLVLSCAAIAVLGATLAVDGYFGFRLTTTVYEYIVYPLLLLLILAGLLIGIVGIAKKGVSFSKTNRAKEMTEWAWNFLLIVGGTLLFFIGIVVLFTMQFIHALLVIICILLFVLVVTVINLKVK